VDAHDSAQAWELIRALRDELHKMTSQLTWLEGQSVTSFASRAVVIRSEAAALRRDIAEAQFHITRLQRRYLRGYRQAPARQLARASQVPLL
jgi:hypothetical protein